jgi:hypothetical protein
LSSRGCENANESLGPCWRRWIAEAERGHFFEEDTKPEDITDVVAFFVTDESRHMNVSVVEDTGGFYRYVTDLSSSLSGSGGGGNNIHPVMMHFLASVAPRRDLRLQDCREMRELSKILLF